MSARARCRPPGTRNLFDAEFVCLDDRLDLETRVIKYFEVNHLQKRTKNILIKKLTLVTLDISITASSSIGWRTCPRMINHPTGTLIYPLSACVTPIQIQNS